MKRLKEHLLAIVIVLIFGSFTGCERQVSASLSGCYFQYEYVNYAWGYAHLGMIITPAGEIYTYDNKSVWVFAQNGQISLANLKANLASSVKKGLVIDAATLAANQLKVGYALQGKSSTPVNQGADMGATICKVLVPDNSDSPSLFQELILTHTGDQEYHNTSTQAAELADWITKTFQSVQ